MGEKKYVIVDQDGQQYKINKKTNESEPYNPEPPTFLEDVAAPAKAVAEHPVDVAAAATRGVMRAGTSILGPQGQEAFEMVANAPIEYGKRIVGRFQGTPKGKESLNPIDVLGTTLGQSEALTHRLSKTAPGWEPGAEVGTLGAGLAGMIGQGRTAYKALSTPAEELASKELFKKSAATPGSRAVSPRRELIPDEVLPEAKKVLPESKRPEQIIIDLPEPTPRQPAPFTKAAIAGEEPILAGKADLPEPPPKQIIIEKPPKEIPLPEQPKVTPEDKAVFKLKKSSMDEKAVPEDVSYWNANSKRISEGASLDESAPNKMSNEIVGDIDPFQAHLAKMENAAGELIEASNAKVTRRELAAVFRQEKKAIQSSGRANTKSGKTAIKDLDGYINDIDPAEPISGGGAIRLRSEEVLDSKFVREFIQGLWEDNRMAYVPGKDLSYPEKVLKTTIGKINASLKDRVGLGYEVLMDVYSNDMGVWKILQKEWKLDGSGLPQMKGWFKNRFMYHFQELEAGNRSVTDPMVKALTRLGQIAGKDYPMMVKDQLVFGRVFPEISGGLQRGTASAQWTRAAEGALRRDPSFSLRTAIDLASYAKSKVAESLLTKEPGLAGKVGQATAKTMAKFTKDK